MEEEEPVVLLIYTNTHLTTLEMVLPHKGTMAGTDPKLTTEAVGVVEEVAELVLLDQTEQVMLQTPMVNQLTAVPVLLSI